jgi:polar amino acid transport system substrate-binding protein
MRPSKIKIWSRRIGGCLLALGLLPACDNAANAGNAAAGAALPSPPAQVQSPAAVHDPTPSSAWRPGSSAAGTIPPPATLVRPGILTVGADLASPPSAYTDRDGQPVGLDVDVAAELAGRLGVQVQIVNTPFSSLLAKLNGGAFDVVISAVTITPARAEGVDVVPYLSVGQSVLAPKDEAAGIGTLDDLSGRHLAVQSGTTFEATLRDLNAHLRAVGKPPVLVDFYATQAEVLAAVRGGRVAGSLHDATVSAYLARRYAKELAVAIPSFAEAPEGIAVAKSQPAVLASVRQAVAAMEADGTLTAIRRKWGLP